MPRCLSSNALQPNVDKTTQATADKPTPVAGRVSDLSLMVLLLLLELGSLDLLLLAPAAAVRLGAHAGAEGRLECLARLARGLGSPSFGGHAGGAGDEWKSEVCSVWSGYGV